MATLRRTRAQMTPRIEQLLQLKSRLLSNKTSKRTEQPRMPLALASSTTKGKHIGVVKATFRNKLT